MPKVTSLVSPSILDLPTQKPSLPPNFPSSLSNAWTGATYANDTSYIHNLTSAEILEIEAALAYFNTLGLDGPDVTPAMFPLPTLAPTLRQINDDLYNGRGFALIRGLDLTKYSVDDHMIIWLGIQCHIANLAARQDTRGNMLVHIVADNSSELAAGHHRHSTKSISFHTEESGDIISWLTRSTAVQGGRCIIASAHHIYNAIAEACPEMVHTLSRGNWPFSMPEFTCRPIFFFENDKFSINFGRTPLLGNDVHPRSPELPSVTPSQRAALDTIEAIAVATQLEIQTQPGDMHFINNFKVLHRRDAFLDGDEPTAKRHLVRMRLRDQQQNRPVPEALRQDWMTAFGEERDRKWHVEPMTPGFFPLRQHSN